MILNTIDVFFYVYTKSLNSYESSFTYNSNYNLYWTKLKY